MSKCIYIIITATVFFLPTLSKAGVERITINEVLDKFSQTVTNYNSFIHKTNWSSSETNNKTTKPIVRFGSSEVRYDGNRIKTIDSSWGQIGGMYVPKNEPTYNSVLWDGRERYQYSRGSRAVEKPSNLAGFVIISHEKRRDFETSGLSFNRGYFTGDTSRIDTRLRQEKSAKLLEEMENVGGSECYVIEADTKYGKYKVWFDPQHGYNIAKAVLERRPGDFAEQFNSVVDPRLWTRREMRNVKFEEVNGVWVLISSEGQSDIKYLHSGGWHKIISSSKITSIQFNPDHEFLKSFSLDDIENGAKVNIFNKTGKGYVPIRYTWQDGKVVDATGKVFIDRRPDELNRPAEPKPKSSSSNSVSPLDLLRKYQTTQTKVENPPSKERVVHFPKDVVLGILKTIEDSQEQPSILRTDFHYQDLGLARGDITVPAGRRLILSTGERQLNNLSHLSSLMPDDLYSLHISGSYLGGLKLNDSHLKHLSGLTGLKQLCLEESQITSAGIQHITGLKSLNYLQVASDRLDGSALSYIAQIQSLATLVSGAQAADEDLLHLAPLKNLKELFLWVRNIRGPGLSYLKELPNLQYLYLNGSNENGRCQFSDSSLAYIKDIPSLRRIRIWWQLPITDTGIAHLAKCPQLEEIELASLPLTDRSPAYLKALPNLKMLDIGSQSKITDAGTIHIAEMKNLESLRLPNSLTDAGAANLAGLKNLKSLGIGGDITDAGLAYIAGLENLETLYLDKSQVTDEGIAHITKLKKLRTLRISSEQMTNKSLAVIGSLKTLEQLTIGGKQMSLSGVNYLNGLINLRRLRTNHIDGDDGTLNISGLTNLESLDLWLDPKSKSKIDDDDMACISKLTKLQSLQLTPHEGISDEGMRHLANLTNLWLISVGGEKVTDEGLAYLANMKVLTNLVISGNFTDKGLRHLEKLEALCVLDIMEGANFSPAAVQRFHRNMPELGMFRPNMRGAGQQQPSRPKPTPSPRK